MPRFYFDLTGDGKAPDDDVGVELKDLTSARAEAILAAKEFVIDKIRADEPIPDVTFVVRDGRGKTLAVVPVRSVVEFTRSGADDKG